MKYSLPVLLACALALLCYAGCATRQPAPPTPPHITASVRQPPTAEMSAMAKFFTGHWRYVTFIDGGHRSAVKQRGLTIVGNGQSFTVIELPREKSFPATAGKFELTYQDQGCHLTLQRHPQHPAMLRMVLREGDHVAYVECKRAQ